MAQDAPKAASKIEAIDWNALLAPYREPSRWRSLWQLGTTALLLAGFWIASYLSLSIGYWLTLIVAVPAALMVVRLFMLQHDCGHGAFFPSQRMNNIAGSIMGIFTLVPYEYWRRTHSMHHATSGDLDRRNLGDIDTLTVREYLSRPLHKRILYRMYRNPLVLLLVGPAWQFILKHRLPLDIPRSWKREWFSVHYTNIGLAAVVTIMWLTLGIDKFLMVQLPITLIAGAIGVYLFYVQHQYEDTYWRYREAWNYFAAGLEGASHLKMNKVMQWCTANIGLHHIHHVSSRIPNYRLQRAFNENPALQKATTLTLPGSVKTLWLTLWDEDERRLVGFRDLKAIRERITREIGAGVAIMASKPQAVPRNWQ
ncbi:MAG TPA: fatty acid desaturase [Gemmatimonadales bacterium]|nr:fatty acid desaturase [Gemmatimonadales bacterium]